MVRCPSCGAINGSTRQYCHICTYPLTVPPNHGRRVLAWAVSVCLLIIIVGFPAGVILNIYVKPSRSASVRVTSHPPGGATDSERGAGSAAMTAAGGFAGAEMGSPSGGNSTAEERIVYLGPYGNYYHKADCRHVVRTKKPVSLGQAREKGYRACPECRP